MGGNGAAGVGGGGVSSVGKIISESCTLLFVITVLLCYCRVSFLVDHVKGSSECT